MARRIISEYRAKTLLATALEQSYAGLSIDGQTKWRPLLTNFLQDQPVQSYVVKVDQGIKGRFKQGLVKLDIAPTKVATTVQQLLELGFRHVLVEPYTPHDTAAERYLSLERVRDGVRILAFQQGGVNFDAATTAPTARLSSPAAIKATATQIGIAPSALSAIVTCFDDNYLGFLEINPLVIAPNGHPLILDAAAEVDAEAVSLVAGGWEQADLRSGSRVITPEETTVLDLASRSQSSFRLEVLNPDGQVFLLLSGGGASVTLADEVNNQGFGQQLGNYGEYSGNPTADETAVYTTQILSLLLKSAAKSKVLVIAGGVANFTDVRATFAGVIKALERVAGQLKQQGIKVYVRRGGPHEAEGLATMNAYLEKAGLLGTVAGPELLLSDIITQALARLKTGGRP